MYYNLVVGGIYLFLKIFVESNREELSKTENNLLTGKEQTSYNYGHEGVALITNGLFQKWTDRGGAGMGEGIVSCLLSLG